MRHLGGGRLLLAAALVAPVACGHDHERPDHLPATKNEVSPRDDEPPPTGLGWGFVDATAEAGIAHAHVYATDVPKNARESMWMAAGVAVGDVDGDDDLDLFALGGPQGDNHLYLNDGRGHFDGATADAGLPSHGGYEGGTTFADVDGDGDLDLLIGGLAEEGMKLFANRGDGSFEDVSASSGLVGSTSDMSMALADFDGDEDLDLFVSHWGSKPAQTVVEHLWVNEGGVFSPATQAAGIEDALITNLFTFSLTPTFSDIDGDGDADLLVASDFGTSRVFVSDGAGHFVDATDASIDDDNGMGSAVGDVDGDGDLDWFVSSIFDANGSEGQWGVSGNRLYLNAGNGRFSNDTDRSGLRQGGWGWGACFADFDLDGNLDLVQTNGYPQLTADDFYDDATVLFVGDGSGRFTEQAEARGLVERDQGRAVVCLDYDLDGDIDVLVSNNQGPLRLWRNDGDHGGYLSVRLEGHLPNMQAIGAWVRIRVGDRWQLREIRAGGSFMSQQPAVAHFGVGSAERVDELDVRWPDGSHSVIYDVAANQRLVVAQP